MTRRRHAGGSTLLRIPSWNQRGTPHSLFATPLGMSAVCAFGPKTEAEAAAPQAKSNVCDGEWRGRLPTAD